MELGSTRTEQKGISHHENESILVAVDTAMEDLLEREDTDRDGLITIDDKGPRDFPLGNHGIDGPQVYQVQGVYNLANLLQELALARINKIDRLMVSRLQLEEEPVTRLSRLIRESWWDNLTRHLDATGIEAAAKDPKMMDSQPRIYVPRGAPEQYAYYQKLSHDRPDINLDVQWLPHEEVTAEFIKGINQRPGVLALAMVPASQSLLPSSEVPYLGTNSGNQEPMEPGDGKLANVEDLKALPFVVPGDRFNELYNWDACFCALGMLGSHIDLVKSVIRNFIFEIEHYGKILNANRSYYLGRAQPPFLTWLALKTYEATEKDEASQNLLKDAILAAMKEYHCYWMTEPRLDKETGLSRYRPIGVGSPPECSSVVFEHILSPYAEKHDMTVQQLYDAYNQGAVNEAALNEFFSHDRAVRESGHDTSTRLEGVAANLATVDLNCLLYRYETDFAYVISTVFGDRLVVPATSCGSGQKAENLGTSEFWRQRAKRRRTSIEKYLWNEERGLFFDYNTVTKQKTQYESATTLWPLWCGVSSDSQAAAVVANCLPKLECNGGLSVGSERSRGPTSPANPQRQWDFPYGWAPHQVLAWDGLLRYGYTADAERLAYRWLHMITKTFINFNGTVVEKYNVTRLNHCHKVDAEYGNQGANFKYVPQEG
ncbi:MAG: hypothetical protein LQ351_000777 [Letrouitia transgressa]|nr:MAG: hypothetical protein LQ351_000777 [Letrouitia transgressa]